MGRFSIVVNNMAYSSVRVQFEIGHEASVRTKKTPEGFTHDWEVFVRGADNTDIQCFVDKVVFHLHETFPKPRRVIKEPPYVVKESGYAGFVLPIDVYLKNKEEPKKISFQYDLTLQTSGPPISRVLREPRLFQNPSEDFRRKLIRGGGVGVDTPSELPQDDLKSTPSAPQNKSKPVDSPAKKHKSDQPMNHSFAELFGTPIRRVPEQKKLPEPPKKLDEKKKSSKPYKEEKEIPKEKYLERDKSKDKAKRPPSPPLPPPLAPQVKSKDEHKKHEEREKKKEEEKRKRKEERKEKAKEPERQIEKEHKKEKKESRDGDYAKKLNSKPPDPKPNYEKHNNESIVDKEKERLEKEKHKHRHKKKEKEKNREKEKHRKEKEKDSREREKEKSSKKKHEEPREKEEKRRKSRSPSPVQMKKGPLNALLDELGSSDSASPLSEEESLPPSKPPPKPPAKPVPEIKPQQPATVIAKPKSTNSNEPVAKPDEASLTKNKKEKSSSKKGKKSEKEPEKKKEKEEHRARSVSSERGEEEEDEEKERGMKDERMEKDRLDEETRPRPKDKENRKRRREKSEERQTKPKKSEGSQSGAMEVSDGAGEELRRPDKFTKEYVAQLRDLQHRIMTLEDNAELQKVVKVIAETGQYEVTKKTFDFDLCALDMETVKRLQEFFAPT